MTSTTAAKAPASSRLPPDGHEFPADYLDAPESLEADEKFIVENLKFLIN